MANYRRLISYIYAYEGGTKGKNVGFAKIENRKDQCRIQVSVRNVYVGSQDIGVYLMSTGGERLLGKIFIRGGVGEFRCMVQMEHGMNDCYGLTIHSIGDSWQSYTTIWEDAVAHAAEVDLSEAVSEKMEQKEMEQVPTDQIPEQSSAETVIRQPSVAEAIEAELEAEEQKVPWEEPEIPAMPQEPPVPTAPEILPGPSEPGPAPVPVTEPSTAPQPPVQEPMPPMTSPVIEPTPEIQPPVTEPVPEPQPPMADPQPVTPQTPGSRPQPAQASQSQEPPETPPPAPAATAQESASTSQAAASAAPDLTFPLPEEHVEAQKLWNFFSRTYPKIQAFDYSGGCEILTIKPQDIGLLPREAWVYGNNSFLLHGYYNHRYLVLARLNNPKGNPRFLIGVPGHYYNNEKYMAAMFGFPNFVLSKMQPAGDGRFGYWYTDIRLD